MDRSKGYNNDRRPRRDDNRPQRNQDRDRSRSPTHKDRRDDRRRERSPPPPKGPRGQAPRNDRDRDSNRDRDRGKDTDKPARSPPRGPRQRPDRQPNTSNRGPAAVRGDAPTADTRMQDSNEIPDDEDSDAAMTRLMGFTGFKTTKNTKVPGNDKNYAVSKVKKAEYRQYMNRVGGFNRPLSPSRV